MGLFEMPAEPTDRIATARRNIERVRRLIALADDSDERLDAVVDELAAADRVRILESEGRRFIRHIQRWARAAREAPAARCHNLQRLVTLGSLQLAAELLVETVADLDLSLSQDAPEREAIKLYVQVLKPKSTFQDYQRRVKARWAHEAALEEEARLERLRAPLLVLLGTLRGAERQIDFSGFELDQVDERLCRSWANSRQSGTFEVGTLGQAIGSYHAMRLYSARLAERAAVAYYTQFGSQVLDVSSHQVSAESDRWKTHDIEVGRVAIDVKHARRSFASHHSYSEHAVANWKLKTRLGANVRLAGVLSDYVALDRFAAGQHPRFRFIGECYVDRLEQDARWFEARTRGRLTFVQLKTPKYFPGWFFEFSDEHYGKPAVEPNEISEAVGAALKSGLLISDVPPPLLLFCRVGSTIEVPGDRRLIAALDEMRTAIGFSRTTAVLFLLSELVLAACGEAEAFEDEALARLILFEGEDRDLDRQRPFGKLDPESFVANFLDALATAWQRAKGELRQFRGFQLAGANILRGDSGNGHWTTIIAYCGGFTAGPRAVRCGLSPLVIGTDAVCRQCRHLICHSCGWCSQDCPQVEANPVRREAEGKVGSTDSEFGPL